MKIHFTILLLSTASYCLVSCGLIPSFTSVTSNVTLLNNSTANGTVPNNRNATTTSSPETSKTTASNNLTTTVDQLIVPKAAIVNASDILPSQKDLTTANTTSANATSETSATTSTVSETVADVTTINGNEIVVPKEAIDNSTLELVITTSTSPPTIAASNATIMNAIVVPKAAVNNDSAVNETTSTNSSPTAAAETEEPNQGLGPISVHKRSIAVDSAEITNLRRVMFQKYDKRTGPRAIETVKGKGQWGNRLSSNTNANYGLSWRRRKREAEGADDSREMREDVEENFEDILKSLESAASEEVNATDLTQSPDEVVTNATTATPVENAQITDKQHLKEDVVDDDDSVCAVNKDDEEATKVVTIFWRSVFCVIFVIIIVYPIYSYTKIYCQKRKRDTESISNDRFVGSDSEISNTTNDCPTPKSTKSTKTTK